MSIQAGFYTGFFLPRWEIRFYIFLKEYSLLLLSFGFVIEFYLAVVI